MILVRFLTTSEMLHLQTQSELYVLAFQTKKKKKSEIPKISFLLP